MNIENEKSSEEAKNEEPEGPRSQDQRRRARAEGPGFKMEI